MTDRDCKYAVQIPPEQSLVRKTSQPVGTPDAAVDQRLNGLATPEAASQSTTPSSRKPPNTDTSPSEPQEAVNLVHMELLIHVTLSHRDLFNLSDDAPSSTDPNFFEQVLNTAPSFPFLLYALLAFSARHLAHLRPAASSASYLHQAVTLQTRAVSLFNAYWAGGTATTEICADNCVAVLLFSTALGHHLLAEALAERGDLARFVEGYVRCLEMQRGIRAIVVTAQPVLMESKLEPILTRSVGFTSATPIGTHCARALALVERSVNLNEQEKEACRVAVRYLQLGFDAIATEGDVQDCYKYQMIFLWSMLAPPEFTALLKERRPEALVVMGYYAAMLHHGRAMWQVGNAGVYLLGVIEEYLGPGWEYWLEYPRSVVRLHSG